MTDTDTELAQALRVQCNRWDEMAAQNEKESTRLSHLPAAHELARDAAQYRQSAWQVRSILDAHDTARAQPASVTDDYREIARLIGCIFFYGGFKAETRNERDLEALLRRTGNFYETEAQLLAAAPQRKE